LIGDGVLAHNYLLDIEVGEKSNEIYNIWGFTVVVVKRGDELYKGHIDNG